MSKKHKHHDLIVAWANGAEIQFKFCGEWRDCGTPLWDEDDEYRIKPNNRQHLIDAYNQGKTVQYKSQDGSWYDIVYGYGLLEPHNDIEYRIKHKYQDVIDAYVRGETVHYKDITTGFWCILPGGMNLRVFDSGQEFRIKPNKHQHLIDAYVRGETVQYQCKTDWSCGWLDLPKGKGLDVFDTYREFRIKPIPKPDVVKTGSILFDDDGFEPPWVKYKFTYDGETGNLKEIKKI